MKETSRQETPLAVVGREPEAPQDAEIRARWAWVEASVWTTRMLRALETGMEGFPPLGIHSRLTGSDTGLERGVDARMRFGG